MSSRKARAIVAAVVVLVVAIALSACGSGSDSESGGTAIDDSAVIIDVRTAEEYASGHLEGALLISVESATFAEDIANLDPDASYLLYCRSGNRAGIALDQMVAAGFSDVTNLGSVADAASATGREVVS